MVCWIVFFVFSIVTCCFNAEQTQSWMLFPTGRGQQCAALWGRRTATSVFFTRRPAAKNVALARHIVEPVLVHIHRHTKTLSIITLKCTFNHCVQWCCLKTLVWFLCQWARLSALRKSLVSSRTVCWTGSYSSAEWERDTHQPLPHKAASHTHSEPSLQR